MGVLQKSPTLHMKHVRAAFVYGFGRDSKKLLLRCIVLYVSRFNNDLLEIDGSVNEAIKLNMD